MSGEVEKKGYRGVFRDPPVERISEVEIRHAQQARRLVESMFPASDEQMQHIYERIRAPLTLFAFNWKNSYPRLPAMNWKLAVEKLRAELTLSEVLAMTNRHLPTVGVELEIEEGFRKHNRNIRTEEILYELGIEYDRQANDYLGSRSDELEVHEEYSYSPKTQSRLLHELTVLGATRLQNGVRRKTRKIANHDAYSLHVNLGLPMDTSSLSDYQRMHDDFDRTRDSVGLRKHAAILTGIFSIGFVSSVRFEKRKTSTSTDLKLADGAKRAMRLELRPFEYKNYQTYRLLAEIQVLSAAMFAYVLRAHYARNMPATHHLAVIWGDFCNESVVQQYADLFEMDAIDYRADLFSAIVSEKANVAAVRSLISGYSRRIREALRAA